MVESLPSIDNIGKLTCTWVFVSDQVRYGQHGSLWLFIRADNPRRFRGFNHSDLDLLQLEIHYQTQMGREPQPADGCLDARR